MLLIYQSQIREAPDGSDEAAQLIRKGWLEIPPRPTPESYWRDGQWQTPPATPQPKVWTVQQFRDLFTDEELSKFLAAAKNNPAVDLMRFKLTTSDEIRSDSEAVADALSALVAIGVISEDKKTAVLNV